jgi:hypothetical protein
MSLAEIDKEAAIREGLTEVKCSRCSRVLAYQSQDGRKLTVNGNADAIGGRVGLHCACGSIYSWRRSKAMAQKPNIYTRT